MYTASAAAIVLRLGTTNACVTSNPPPCVPEGRNKQLRYSWGTVAASLAVYTDATSCTGGDRYVRTYVRTYGGVLALKVLVLVLVLSTSTSTYPAEEALRGAPGKTDYDGYVRTYVQ